MPLVLGFRIAGYLTPTPPEVHLKPPFALPRFQKWGEPFFFKNDAQVEAGKLGIEKGTKVLLRYLA